MPSKEINAVSKIFQIFTLFCLCVWIQYAFQPAAAAPIPEYSREKRSPFAIDTKTSDNIAEKSGNFNYFFFKSFSDRVAKI